MKVKISENLCIGCGACAATLPNVFDISDKGVSEVVNQPTNEEQEEVKEMASSCPTNAIFVEEEEKNN